MHWRLSGAEFGLCMRVSSNANALTDLLNKMAHWETVTWWLFDVLINFEQVVLSLFYYRHSYSCFSFSRSSSSFAVNKFATPPVRKSVFVHQELVSQRKLMMELAREVQSHEPKPIWFGLSVLIMLVLILMGLSHSPIIPEDKQQITAENARWSANSPKHQFAFHSIRFTAKCDEKWLCSSDSELHEFRVN